MTPELTEIEINNEALQVAQAQKDPAAFSPLYQKYYPDIFKYIFRRTNDEEATADLTSQVFLKAMLHLYKWKNEGVPFSAWLYRISLNECREYFRRTKRIQYVVLDETTKAELVEELFPEDKSTRFQLIEKLIKKLPQQDLQLVELRFYEKLSFKDIGYYIGVTENNAKVKLYRILQKIKRKINHEL